MVTGIAVVDQYNEKNGNSSSTRNHDSSSRRNHDNRSRNHKP